MDMKILAIYTANHLGPESGYELHTALGAVYI